MTNNWSQIPFSQAVLLNPSMTLKRGEAYPFVDMAAIEPTIPLVRSIELREFKGSGSRFQSGDTLMARITPCLENGKIARYAGNPNEVAHGSTEFIVIRGRKDVSDSNYAYYLTKWEYVRQFAINQMQGTSGRQRVPASSLEHLYVPLPPLAEQRAIAHILGSLDDKIELNRQMNATLEEMARAIFKSWFVDFDPVHAKARGEQPAVMDVATAALFPDSFEDSELGSVPRGWKIGELQDIADIVMGASPKGDTYNADGVGTPLINGPVEFGEYFPNRQKWTTAPTRLSVDKDLIFCVRGSTTGRRVVADGVYCLGRGVCAIRSKTNDQEFINRLIDCRLEELLRKTSGSVFPNLSAIDIKSFRIHLPCMQLINVFSKLTRAFEDQTRANVSASRTLAELRDTLLPKLMSGELRVQEATEMTEAVA